MSEKAIQDLYPDELARCYGCGRANAHGLQLKSYWTARRRSPSCSPSPTTSRFPATSTEG